MIEMFDTRVRSATTQPPIVVLEDDPLVANDFARVLGMFRRTIIASSIRDFDRVERREKRFCAVLIGDHLPDGRGIDVAKRIRERPDFVPAAIATGDHRQDVCAVAFRLQVKYVCKPLGEAELLSFVSFSLMHESSGDSLFAEDTTSRMARWDFTPAETCTVLLALRGLRAGEIARTRGTSQNGHKSLVRTILRKSGAQSLDALVLTIISP